MKHLTFYNERLEEGQFETIVGRGGEQDRDRMKEAESSASDKQGGDGGEGVRGGEDLEGNHGRRYIKI